MALFLASFFYLLFPCCYFFSILLTIIIYFFVFILFCLFIFLKKYNIKKYIYIFFVNILCVKLRGDHEWNSPILHLTCMWSRHKSLWTLLQRHYFCCFWILNFLHLSIYIFTLIYLSLIIEIIWWSPFVHFLCTTKHMVLFFIYEYLYLMSFYQFLSIYFTLSIYM